MSADDRPQPLVDDVGAVTEGGAVAESLQQVKVTVGGAPRQSRSLLRLLRATNRAAMPLKRIDSDAVFGSSRGSASMLPVFLV